MNESPPEDVEKFIQVDAKSHYDPVRYITPGRLASIGHQVLYMQRHFAGGKTLEVGVGTGLGARFFAEMGCEVHTLDVDKDLEPTILGSVTDIPAEDAAFESFVCCQVLEHLPWGGAQQALRELRRVASKGGVISVPTTRACLAIRFFPLKKNARSLVIPLPWLGSKKLHVPDQHHWELGLGVSLATFRRALRDVGFTVLEDRQVVENPYHHFFVVAPSEG